MKKKYTLGIAGYGRIVELIHIPIIKKIENLEVTDVYDITGDRLNVARNRGMAIHRDIAAFLKSDVDIILIATPPSSHHIIAIEALKNNKHIIIEKPVATTLDDAISIKNLSEKTGKKVFVFQNRRFTPDYLAIKNILKNDGLGKITYIARRHHQPRNSVSFGVKSFDPEWRIKESFGGGALLDWGIHLIDQLISLIPGPVRSVQSFIHHFDPSAKGAEDYVSAVILLENNVILKFEVNFQSHLDTPDWIIDGEKRSLTIRNSKEVVFYEKGRAVETLELEKESRFLGKEIYESLLDTLDTDKAPVIQMEDIIKGMEIVAAVKGI